MDRSWAQPVSVGVVSAVIGVTSSFAVVLAGLSAAGADPAQAASGLVVLTALMGLATIWLSRRFRRPLTIAWSTPGAALLASTGAVAGGWPAAVGAFVVVGLLVVATGLVRPLGRLVGAIPAPIAQAMLAGVLLPLCLAPVRALVERPLLVAPIVVLWVVLSRVAPRWASPAAFGLALVIVMALADGWGWLQAPRIALTLPSFSLAAVVGVALPLWVVTMASQNVPGVAVLGAAGYRVPWRYAMVLTGAGTALGAPAGAHAINLAAITAALPASPEAHPDPARRWIACQANGVTCLLLAPLATTLAALVAAAPPGVVESVAGLALLGTFGAALAGALAVADGTPDPAVARVPAAATFLVSAAGVTIAGIGGAFWGLLAGVVLHLALRRRAAAA
ncbi:MULTISPECIES: benzoate/H(+) symporter BenE family transporter [unclassified Pseudonocardia]|uniref:benzoate/H(+) symporter BenE family transporter n=1 Tax=unclassified Pseudonocardia TaxID=2619320 RepID=UPI00094B0280|nr:MULTISPECIES: benzoate/H(+) symporter BenE family transporter [unclassified Pseudonocardia]OLL97448.1 Benzoate transport protein [Pseudonocardia sp. Ae331_Ps2]OLM33503.1 Benzoate transport protein [Pseudonocardia sp. Ae717_Ps2]